MNDSFSVILSYQTNDFALLICVMLTKNSLDRVDVERRHRDML